MKLPKSPWEAAVHLVADRARTCLALPGQALDAGTATRLNHAIEIVLAGGVTLTSDHSAVVASQSEPLKGYAVNGACPCEDYQRGHTQCKHRLAERLYRRALELAQPETWEPEIPPTEPPVYTPETVALVAQEALALPEAPASVNVRLLIAGRDVQLTLRDTDEARLLTRLHAVLAQYPGTEPTPRETMTQGTEGWCALHGVQMRQQHNKRGSWWSHRVADGYCKGK